MSLFNRWRQDVAGATAVEFAVLGPVFLTLIYGVLQGGLMLWTQLALQQATERAARCASINTSVCGTSTQTQEFAATQTLGRNLPSDSFTVTTQPCGSFVSGAYATELLTYTIGLKAQSCFPK
ncbi:MAG: TadE/TadG family type IV pilus assembly protein [Prosthecobacter sp.]|nr:TadE/TadG family type IV pilus assembly protein [Prosthecobacter sp.]